jgi:hypothetical protein
MNPSMTQSLSIGQVFSGAWNLVQTTWPQAKKPLLTYVGMTVIYLLINYTLPFLPMDPDGLEAGVINLVVSAGSFVYFFAVLWPLMQLTSLFLQADGAKVAITPAQVTGSAVGTFLWINVLTGLFTTLGTIALLLPGIWVSVAIQFGGAILVEEGKHGMEAIKESMRLVSGRWWKTAWRIFCPSLVIALGISLLVIAFAAATFFLFSTLPILNSGENLDFSRLTISHWASLGGFGVLGLGCYLGALSVAMLFGMGVQTKVYHWLKATKPTTPNA